MWLLYFLEIFNTIVLKFTYIGNCKSALYSLQESYWYFCKCLTEAASSVYTIEVLTSSKWFCMHELLNTTNYHMWGHYGSLSPSLSRITLNFDFESIYLLFQKPILCVLCGYSRWRIHLFKSFTYKESWVNYPATDPASLF